MSCVADPAAEIRSDVDVLKLYSERMKGRMRWEAYGRFMATATDQRLLLPTRVTAAVIVKKSVEGVVVEARERPIDRMKHELEKGKFTFTS